MFCFRFTPTFLLLRIRWPYQVSCVNFCCDDSIYTIRLQQKCCHFADDIFKWIFFSENVWWFRFQWNLFIMVQLTISQRWFRYWLGATEATSHYLNQWWHILLMHIHLCVFSVLLYLGLVQNYISIEFEFQMKNCCYTRPLVCPVKCRPCLFLQCM